MIPVVEFFIRSPPDPVPSPTATPANPGPARRYPAKSGPDSASLRPVAEVVRERKRNKRTTRYVPPKTERRHEAKDKFRHRKAIRRIVSRPRNLKFPGGHDAFTNYFANFGRFL